MYSHCQAVCVCLPTYHRSVMFWDLRPPPPKPGSKAPDNLTQDSLPTHLQLNLTWKPFMKVQYVQYVHTYVRTYSTRYSVTVLVSATLYVRTYVHKYQRICTYVGVPCVQSVWIYVHTYVCMYMLAYWKKPKWA